MDKFISLDIETSGLGLECVVLEVGCVCSNGLESGWLIDNGPGFYMEPYAAMIHAKNGLLADLDNPGVSKVKAQDFGSSFRNFLDLCGINALHVPVIGKNAAMFDIPFLYRMPRFNVRFRHRVMDIGQLYMTPKHSWVPSLEALFPESELVKTPHRALEDARLVMELYKRWCVQ